MDDFKQMKQNKKLKKQDRWFLVSSVLTLIIGAFFTVLFILSLFYPKANLQIGNVTLNGNEHAMHGHFIRGNFVNFRVGICKITDIPVEVTVELFDGDKDNIPMISKISYTKKGCVNMVLVGVVPTTAPLGEYNIRVVAHQKINPNREVHKEVIIPNIKIVDVEH